MSAPAPTHLLLIHQVFAGPDEPGGTRHSELGSRFVAAGHKLTVVASSLNYFTGKRKTKRPRLVELQQVRGIDILLAYTFQSLHRNFVWRTLSFFSFMLSSFLVGIRVRNVDVVMATSPPMFQAFSAWLVAALRRKPLLLEIRDLWVDFAVELGVLKNPALIALARRAERFLYRHAAHILVNSPAYRDHIIAAGIPARRVSLIPNGVDVRAFAAAVADPSFRERWRLRDKFVVVYAGALGMANDIPVILRAAQRLEDDSQIHFMIVGEGKEREALARLAAEMHLHNLSFVPPLAKSEVPGMLQSADACLATLRDIPMFTTTYPNKVFDYMAAGKPVILAIDGVIREVVEKAGGGIFVTPSDDAALAGAVRRLKNDPAAARAMGEAGQKYVALNFDRDMQARAFAGLVVSMARPS